MKLGLPRYLITSTLIGLAVALALSVGYWNIRPASFSTTQLVSDPLQPDFFMENTRILMLNTEGQPVYELTSERATHQLGSDSTLLSNPRLLFYREGEEQPWLLTSKRGLVTEGGDTVELEDDVLLEQQLSNQPVSRMTTQALTLFPARDYAETEQSVRIEAARNVTTATGMQLYLNDGRLTLLSNVRGQHEAR